MLPTNLKPGDVYLFSDSEACEFFVQVGVGTDCGVFSGSFDKATHQNSNLNFRVLINQSSLRKSMRRIGRFPLHPELDSLCLYWQPDISSEFGRIVNLDYSIDRTEIKEDAGRFEKLAVWEIHHIIKRLTTGKMV